MISNQCLPIFHSSVHMSSVTDGLESTRLYAQPKFNHESISKAAVKSISTKWSQSMDSRDVNNCKYNSLQKFGTTPVEGAVAIIKINRTHSKKSILIYSDMHVLDPL